MDSARVIYEVVAGIIPGQADPKHTRRFGVTSAEYEQGALIGGDQKFGLELLLWRWHEAVAYAPYLQLLCADGREVNWVQITFLWP